MKYSTLKKKLDIDIIKNKKILIVGAGASGKDTLKNKLSKEYFYNPSISITSRPIRDNETNYKDYVFMSKEYFLQNNFEYTSLQNYNNWYYGLLKSEVINKNLFIVSVDDIDNIFEEHDPSQFIIIYLDTPKKIRKERLSKRNDFDNVDRRLKVDKKMFKNFTKIYYCKYILKNIDYS